MVAAIHAGKTPIFTRRTYRSFPAPIGHGHGSRSKFAIKFANRNRHSPLVGGRSAAVAGQIKMPDYLMSINDSAIRPFMRQSLYGLTSPLDLQGLAGCQSDAPYIYPQF